MSDKSDTSYEVECILDKMHKRDRIYYKIKWAGYPYSECTWEPSNHLSGNCDRLIREFEDRQKQQRKRKRKKTRTRQPKAPIPSLNSTQNTTNKLTKYFKKNSQGMVHNNDMIKLENAEEPKFNYFSQGHSRDRYIDELIGIMTSSRDKKLSRQQLRQAPTPRRGGSTRQSNPSRRSGVVRAKGRSPTPGGKQWVRRRDKRGGNRLVRKFPFASGQMERRRNWQLSRKPKVIEMTDSDEDENVNSMQHEEVPIKREERFVVETGMTSDGPRKKLFNHDKRPIIKSRNHRFWSNRRRTVDISEKGASQTGSDWRAGAGSEKPAALKKKKFQSMLQSKNVRMMRTPTFSRSQGAEEGRVAQQRKDSLDLSFEKKPFRRQQFYKENQRYPRIDQNQKNAKLGRVEREKGDLEGKSKMEQVRETIERTSPDKIMSILQEKFSYKELNDFGFEKIQNLVLRSKYEKNEKEYEESKEKKKQRTEGAENTKKVQIESEKKDQVEETKGEKEGLELMARDEAKRLNKDAEINIKKKIEGIENNIIQMLMNSAEKKIRKTFKQKDSKSRLSQDKLRSQRESDQLSKEGVAALNASERKSQAQGSQKKPQDNGKPLFTPFKMNSSVVDYQKVKDAQEEIIRHRVEKGQASKNELDYFRNVIAPKERAGQATGEPVEVVDLQSSESKKRAPENVIICGELVDKKSSMIEISSETGRRGAVVVDSAPNKSQTDAADESNQTISSQMELIRRNLQQKKMFSVQRDGDNKEAKKVDAGNKQAPSMQVEKQRKKKVVPKTRGENAPEISVNSTQLMKIGGEDVGLQKRNFSEFNMLKNGGLDLPGKKVKNQISVSSVNESVFPNESDPSERSPKLEKPGDMARLQGQEWKRASQLSDIKEKRSRKSFHLEKKSKEASTDCFDLETAVYGNFVLRHTDRIKIVSNIVVEQKLYLKVRRYRRVAQGRGLPHREEQETMFLPPEALRKVRPDLLCKFFEKHMKFI